MQAKAIRYAVAEGNHSWQQTTGELPDTQADEGLEMLSMRRIRDWETEKAPVQG